MDDPFARLALLMVRRRRLVIGLWIVLLAACGVLWPRADAVVKTSGFSLPETQSAHVADVLHRDFSASAGADVAVVFRSPGAIVNDSSYRQTIIAATESMLGLQDVQSVRTFFNSADPSLVSPDGHTTLALVSFRRSDDPTVVTALRDRLQGLPMEHYVTGDLAVQQDTFATSKDDLARFELIAVPIIIILLLIVFRTAIAATIPLLLGACAITVATALIAVIGSVMDVSLFALNIASMIGLGLGIDFSLILINRFRQELASGLEPPASRFQAVEATARTMATAGRSITFSAVTVMLSMLVMTLVMHDFMILRSISLGVALVAATSLLAALTVLPAMLGVLGHRIEWLRVIPSRPPREDQERGIWYRLSHAIMRRPWIWLLISLLALAVLALPARDLNTGVETTGALPSSAESVRGAQVLGSAFGPGRVTPIQILVQTRPNGVWTPPFLRALRQLTNSAAADPRVLSVQSLSTVAEAAGIPASRFASLSRQSVTARTTLAGIASQVVNLQSGNDEALIIIVPRTEEFAAAHQRLVHDLRDRMIPAVPELRTNDVSVGGEAANSIDFNETVYGRFPLIVAAVLLMTFVVLLMFFQSITLPLKAIFMNLATMLATYGAVVLIFQRGWGSGPLGFSTQGMVDLVTPVILYAILFALSTDYEVFLLSRVKEYYHRTRNNTEAVAAGLESVGGMITAAGVILIVTFAAFATSQVLTLKELGIGLAVGVLLDSTVVRVIMVPATMRLMGEWNWWMPAGLKRVVPEIREGPLPQPLVGTQRVPAADTQGVPAPADATAANQTVRLARPAASGGAHSAPPSGRPTGAHPASNGRLLPIGDSIGTDAIDLPPNRPLSIGRDRACELQLFDPRISRFHTRIDFSHGQYVVTDLGSTNGTYVNDVRLPTHGSTVLHPGDSIQIGTFRRVILRFQLFPIHGTSGARTPAIPVSGGDA